MSGQRARGKRTASYASLEVEGWGQFWLGWTRRGLVTLRLPPVEAGADEEDAVRLWLERRFDAVERAAAAPARFTRPLLRYLAGEDEPLDVPLEPLGTPFQLRVWEALRRIPRGRVRTYLGVARDIGEPRAMRAVGRANHANPLPILVPCHRVIESGLGLGGFGGGLELKRRLLALEGVEVRGERVVPPGQLSLGSLGEEPC